MKGGAIDGMVWVCQENLRVEYAGAIYHVMSRGNRGDSIFLDEKDHRIFIDTLEEACTKTGWLVHAFVLMGNHYHLLLETPEANLVVGHEVAAGDVYPAV